MRGVGSAVVFDVVEAVPAEDWLAGDSLVYKITEGEILHVSSRTGRDGYRRLYPGDPEALLSEHAGNLRFRAFVGALVRRVAEAAALERLVESVGCRMPDTAGG